MYLFVVPTVAFGCLRCAVYYYERMQWKKDLKNGWMSWEPSFPVFATSFAVIMMIIGTIEMKTGVIVSNDCPKMKKETKVVYHSKVSSCKIL